MDSATSTDLAWAAGFFDGEGCVQINKAFHSKRQGYQVSLSVRLTQVNPRPLQKFKDLFGGYLSATKKYPGRRQAYQWRTTSKSAETCLQALLPYLVNKKDEAIVGLIYRDTCANVGRVPYEKVDQLIIELRRLKAKEWITDEPSLSN